MISKVRYQQLDDQGERYFTVTDSVTVPLLTELEASAGKERSFNKGGKFSGIPVYMQIAKKDGELFVPFGEVQGFMVSVEDGVYLVPMEIVGILEEAEIKAMDTAKTVVKDVAEVAETVIQKTEDEVKNFNPKHTLGFSYKQLLVIGVAALLIVKLTK
jgi:hypothetical protein